MGGVFCFGECLLEVINVMENVLFRISGVDLFETADDVLLDLIVSILLILHEHSNVEG